jgi:hypothetical protein
LSRLAILGVALAAALTLLWGQPRQLSLVLVDRDGRKTASGDQIVFIVDEKDQQALYMQRSGARSD